MSVGIRKKISLYFFYRKTVNKCKKDLLEKVGARIDNVNRIYTVINIPKDLIDEPYNLRKSDIDALSEKFIKEYSRFISEYLDDKGLKEMYNYYNIEKVDKYSYLVVFGFSLFNTQRVAKNIIFYFLPIAVLSSIIFYILYKLFI